ncbi:MULTISPECIES: hypothetical protein [unclassified Flavobacterium]|uniref:hypothetical protein n=1 Tax=unclassified Flavobacterium TaxID=196869 RepID=UPI00131E35D6|nr:MULTISPECIES: hypothetical protein [unclassified Flavobacterium]
MKNKIFILVASLTVLIGCKNEIEKQKKTVNTDVEKISDKGKQLNVNDIIGKWIERHNAENMNITFDKNGQFTFNTVDNKDNKITYRGKYKLKEETVILTYQDGSEYHFSYFKDEGMQQYCLASPDYNMVKQDDGLIVDSEYSDMVLNIQNENNLLINSVDIDKVYDFKVKEYKVKIIVLGSGGATDFGAYRKTYLVFDNGYEMPRRYALFCIGNFGTIDKVIQIKPEVLYIEGKLFRENDKSEQICNNCNIQANIDISNLIKQEKERDKLNDESEGNVNSKIKLSIIKNN